MNVEKLQLRADSLGWQDGGQRVEFSDVAVSGVLQQGMAEELVLPSANLQLSAGRFEYEEPAAALSMALDGL